MWWIHSVEGWVVEWLRLLMLMLVLAIHWWVLWSAVGLSFNEALNALTTVFIFARVWLLLLADDL